MSPCTGRIAALDYGTVRVGIAISNLQRTISSPVESYTRRGADQDARRMKRLVEEEGVTLFVVGLPVHLDGRESAKSLEARRFGQWITQVTGVPVEFFDERFSTSQAHEILSAAQMKGKRRKQRLDMLAAQIILSAYLEAGSKGQPEPGPLDDTTP